MYVLAVQPTCQVRQNFSNFGTNDAVKRRRKKLFKILNILEEKNWTLIDQYSDNNLQMLEHI